MIDREKVIKGLECCRNGFCFSCPYNDGVDGNVDCKQKWADDCLDLLKEQEPRVMTLEEVKAFGWDYCYLEEERLPGKEYRSVCGDYALTCITWPCVTSMRIQHGDESYGKKWRCWNKRPTEEERKRYGRQGGKWRNDLERVSKAGGKNDQ